MISGNIERDDINTRYPVMLEVMRRLSARRVTLGNLFELLLGDLSGGCARQLLHEFNSRV